MNLSNEKKTALYAAIHDPIMDQRVSIQNSKDELGEKNANDLDEMMFRMNQRIWINVKLALKING